MPSSSVRARFQLFSGVAGVLALTMLIAQAGSQEPKKATAALASLPARARSDAALHKLSGISHASQIKNLKRVRQNVNPLRIEKQRLG